MIAEPSATDRSLPAPPRALRWIAAAAVAIAVVAGGVALWRLALAGSEPSVSLQQLQLGAVRRGDLVRDVLVQGRAVAAASPTLFAPVAGIVELAVQAGDTVSAGQVLARLRSPELQAERERESALLRQLQADLGRSDITARQRQLAADRDADEATLALTAARRDVQRTAEACAAGVVSQVECLRRGDAVRAGEIRSAHAGRQAALLAEDSGFERTSLAERVQRQRAVVADVERRVDALQVRVPEGMASARVGSVAVADRAAVPANAPLLTVVDLSRLEVDLQVAEGVAADLGAGLPLVLDVAGQRVAAELVAVAPEVRAGQVQLRARFAAGAQPAGLRQNQRLSGRVVIDQRSGVVVAPRGEWVDRLGGHHVYRVGDGIAERVPVTLGATGAAGVEILQGLEPGARIVLAGHEHLAGAERVRLRP